MERSSLSPLSRAPALAPGDVVAGYFARRPPATERGTLLLPGAPRIYALLGGTSDARLTIRRRTSDVLPRVGFIGPTTKIAHLEHGDAILFGLRLRTTSWASLFGGDLSRFTDRVVPLSAIDLSAPPLVCDPGGDPAAAFAPWLAARLAAASDRDRLSQRLIDVIDADPRTSVAEVAAALRITPQQLSVACLHGFGLPPKRLLMLRRFLRVLRRILPDPTATGRVLWQAGYVDHSHFAKDCRRFLDMSLQGFRQRIGDADDLA
ncbi:helix-turn-helix domain-containing protein [Sphingomonas sp. LR60]|uniref:helix-turn-helix domain-containing protein n=1 Tax=Sphingomonas sp. LR60 TaxID=3050233 RepID=UPI002FE02977